MKKYSENEAYEAPRIAFFEVLSQAILQGSEQIDPIDPGTGGEV